MFDQLLELFERDRRSSTSQQGGLRGKLGSLLGGDADESDRSAHRNDNRQPGERTWDDDAYEDDHRSRRSKRREFEPFDFGD